MDIEKLKAEFEQSECFKKLEHVAQYTFFEFGAYIKRTDVPDDVEKKCEHLITALIFSWKAWREAKAQAVPEGFVVASTKDLNIIYDQINDWNTDWPLVFELFNRILEAQDPANESE
ncbi:hypothetical protein [Acinetobacter indicus]|uniref:hypothetical protein n=1 Tax=Acinetobacter indicus TaxID=756892 RepID=UPI00209A6AE9|nr:hypothetical protein [Acinetobacter indicus]MCO8100942.1 hypothetical protein [Acinetobacter indicus]MCO8106527.1 hypothetical protein [Acinetobacter indicus]MCO8112218.1 hypothetical protein [Acinetobacter indicus]